MVWKKIAMMPSCKETSVLLSQGQDRPLTWLEKIRVRLHLALCAGCRNCDRQIDFLRAAMRRYRDR